MRTEKVLRRGFDAVLHFAALALVPESVAQPDALLGRELPGRPQPPRGHEARGACGASSSRRRPPSTASRSRSRSPRTRPHAPVNPYGATKLAFEFALRAEANATGLRYIALRYFNAAGASDEGDLGERTTPRRTSSRT